MASKKDFAPNQRRRKQPASATTRKPSTPKKNENKAPTKAKAAPKAKPARKKPWPLIILAIGFLCAIGFLLQHLTTVDPREIREASITALINDEISKETIPDSKPAPINKPQIVTPIPSAVNKVKSTPNTSAKKEIAKKVPVADKSIEAEKKEPYQFYEMLSNSSVDTETIEAYKSTPKTAKLKNKTLLQTGSFRNAQDADKMKARLILNNLPNVTVDKTESANGIWYRVRTGPYLTFDTLKAALVKLNKMNISSLQIPVS